MRRLLWVGDAGVPSGFARATHETLDVLRETWDVTVLGMNYRGDPHSYSYPIYAAAVGGDALGVGRLIWMCDLVRPDAIVFQNDPWHVPYYTRQLDKFKEYANVARIGAIAVDGKLCQGYALNGLNLSIFWTRFGEEEARRGGFSGRSSIVPLGVDVEAYSPGDKREARRRRGFPEALLDGFVVGNVNRNQPRKRLDLTIQYFAEWVHRYDVDDAYLYLHVAPTGDDGYDCRRLAQHYDVSDKMLLMEPAAFYGISEGEMVDTYRSFDVQISTTLGEGFGLTSFEGMACAVPQIVPDWSALGELLQGAARLVSCTATAVAPVINTIGGVADREQTVLALDDLYRSAELREKIGLQGYTRALEPRFRWRNVGEAFRDALDVQVGSNVEAIV